VTFPAFALTLGLFLALMASMAAWLFRVSSAPLAVRLIVPALVIASACVIPYEAAAIMGWPVSASLSDLPQRAELLAFVSHDRDMKVDLWLRDGDGQPRAYEVAMDENMKRTLRAAGEKLGRGGRVGLVKGKNRHPGVTDLDSPAAPYELDDNAFLPPAKD